MDLVLSGDPSLLRVVFTSEFERIEFEKGPPFAKPVVTQADRRTIQLLDAPGGPFRPGA